MFIPARIKFRKNLLKFYIHFSAPMSRDEVYRHIHLIDENGAEVVRAFLELEQGLWDQSMQRFTLLFDPGRIKRGLAPHKELGPALKEGKIYKLVVDRAWEDANGDSLVENYTKTFQAVAADRLSPNHNKWQLISPAVGTRDAFKIILGEPLDHELLKRLLTVYDNHSEFIEGRVEAVKEEKEWHFIPDREWNIGLHTVRIDPVLEDLAGNTLNYLFDEEMSEQEKPIKSKGMIEVKFEVY